VINNESCQPAGEIAPVSFGDFCPQDRQPPLLQCQSGRYQGGVSA
jgi:hypothetical protein